MYSRWRGEVNRRRRRRIDWKASPALAGSLCGVRAALLLPQARCATARTAAAPSGTASAYACRDTHGGALLRALAYYRLTRTTSQKRIYLEHAQKERPRSRMPPPRTAYLGA